MIECSSLSSGNTKKKEKKAVLIGRWYRYPARFKKRQQVNFGRFPELLTPVPVKSNYKIKKQILLLVEKKKSKKSGIDGREKSLDS